MNNEYEIISRNISIAAGKFHRIIVIDETFLDYIAKLKASYTELLVSFYPYCQKSKLRRQEWERYKQEYDIFTERAEAAWNTFSSRDLNRAIQPRYTFDGQTVKKSFFISKKNIALYCTELNDAITFINTGDPNNEADVETVKKHSAYHHQGFLYLSTSAAETNLGKNVTPGRWKEVKRLSTEYEQLSNVFLSQAVKTSVSKGNSPALQKYIEFFKHLKRSNRSGELAPHKIILMLAVLRLYDDSKQQNKTVIQLSSTLKSYFDTCWDTYVKSSTWIKDISMPWVHMKSEPFWNDCQNKEGCCWIDSELRELLKDKENRISLSNILKEQLSLTVDNKSHNTKETKQAFNTYRSNKRWSKVEIKKLIDGFKANESFAEIAQQLHRTETAVASKLQELGYVYWDKETETYLKK